MIKVIHHTYKVAESSNEYYLIYVWKALFAYSPYYLRQTCPFYKRSSGHDHEPASAWRASHDSAASTDRPRRLGHSSKEISFRDPPPPPSAPNHPTPTPQRSNGHLLKLFEKTQHLVGCARPSPAVRHSNFRHILYLIALLLFQISEFII